MKISENFCQIWGKKRCQFYSEHFTLFISIITLSLKALAILVTLMLLPFIKSVELYKNSYSRSESDLGVLRRHGLATDLDLYSDEPNVRNEQEASEETVNLTVSPNQYPERNKHQSDADLNTVGGRSLKKDTISAHLSEGELVPPLNPNMKIKKSTSKASNSNSVLSIDSSLSAIANTVGDDHDSDSSTLQDNLGRSQEFTKSPTINEENNKNKAVVETDF